MEIEITSPLRPRDIQARVRAGESVDDVAAAGGVTAAHVERFAYPVLLERARVAEIARRAHPLLPADPTHTDERTLGEIVAATFAARGQDFDEGRWDASKAEGASWVVTLSWQAGRSDNVARWAFRPGASGGTVDPRDDPARELLGQEPTGGPRRVDKPEAPGAGDVRDTLDEALEQTPAMAASGDIAPRRSAGTGQASPTHGTGQNGSRRPERGAARRGGRPQRPGTPQSARPGPTGGDQVPAPRTGQQDPAPAPAEPATAEITTPTTDPGEGSRRGRRSHPIVPSWEDVLLGTRSPRT